MKSKKYYLVLSAMLLAITPCQGEEQTMDVLFIIIDDMNDWTTLYDPGNPIQTPNLERLAARGAFFTHAYSAAPACNPSRVAVMTGLLPTTSGIYGNASYFRYALPDAVTLPQYFARYGHATRGAGKIFHVGGMGRDGAIGYGDEIKVSEPSFQEFLPMQREPRLNLRPGAFGVFDWGPLPEDIIDTDEYTVDWCIARMEDRPQDKPLFLAAGIRRPHLPFYAPEAFFDAYPFDDVIKPPMPKDELDDIPPRGIRNAHRERDQWSGYLFGWEDMPRSQAKTPPMPNPPDDCPSSLKNLIRAYQAACTYADASIGRLLDKLDDTGRRENTIIVLWSDNGYHLGDKGSVVKHSLWEKATRVPFIIAAPGTTKPGSRIDTPVNLVSIYKTLVELAGLPYRSGLDGESLVPLLKDPAIQWKQPAIQTWGRGEHAVRSRNWRYIRYLDGTEELYDSKVDGQWNHTNLAFGEGAEAYAEVISELSRWLPVKEAEAVPPRRPRQ